MRLNEIKARIHRRLINKLDLTKLDGDDPIGVQDRCRSR
jgi:hypothetical protein